MAEHRTDDELDFVTWLSRKYRGAERIEVLRTYVLALRQRTRWDGVDSGRVIAHAEECLRKAWQYED